MLKDEDIEDGKMDFLWRIMEENTDWCTCCGTEHSYMSGPCDKCGCSIFTKEQPISTEK